MVPRLDHFCSYSQGSRDQNVNGWDRVGTSENNYKASRAKVHSWTSCLADAPNQGAMPSGYAPVCHRSEPLWQEPVFEWRDVHPGARTLPVPLSSSVPGQDLRHRYTTAATTTTTKLQNNLPAAAGKTPKSCVVVATVVSECSYKNGGCVQYCKDLPGGAGVQCGCADGYELQSDGRRCSKTGDIVTQHLQLLTINQFNHKHGHTIAGETNKP